MENKVSNKTKIKNNVVSKNYLGSITVMLSGLIIFFLLVLGSITDNRFGTHLVLNSDLSSGPGWYLATITLISILIIMFGVVMLILEEKNLFKINNERDRALIIGSIIMIGSTLFVLALSSQTFAAFNWQFFKSQIENGISSNAISMMTLSFLGIVSGLSFIIYGLIVPFLKNEKLYLTLRNTTVASVALGWFAFNVCINSFGALGGDANILVSGLTGNDELLTNLGLMSSEINNLSAKDFYEKLLETFPDLGLPSWVVAQGVFTDIYEGTNSGATTSIFINNFPAAGVVIEAGGLQYLISNLGDQLIQLGTGKEGMIMGVNNSFNSYAIFLLLLAAEFIGLPLYAYFTYKNTGADKNSIMFLGSLIVVITMSSIYLFLLLTPYMVNYDPETDYVSTIDMLFNGNYGVSIAPGLIALPGEDGGIHSAIVYFSDEYSGTVTWWIAESLTFVTPIAAYIGSWLFIKYKKNEPN